MINFDVYVNNAISGHIYKKQNFGEYFHLVSLFVKNLPICKLFVYEPVKNYRAVASLK